MSRSYVPPPDTVIGVQLMGRLFEHQVRMAQMVGAAMLTANPMLAPRRSRVAHSEDTTQPHLRAQMQKTVQRTHAMPV